jgi:hypothetical protein
MQCVELPLEGTFYPLGFPFRVATNSRDVLRAVEETWGTFQRAFDMSPIRARVLVAEDNSTERPVAPVFRAQGHLLSIISDRANFAICDLAQGFAFCWLSSAAAADREFSRYYFLDSIIYLTLWQSHLTPIHAACVALNGHGVLLGGESGAGKTTLAFACSRRGWTFLSDDVSPIVRGGNDRIVRGTPHIMHFSEKAADLLPELKGRPVARRADGKMSVEVRTANLEGLTTAFECRADHLIFLNRQVNGPARFKSVPRDDALGRLLQPLPIYEPNVHEEHKASLQNFLEVGALELCYSDLDSAVHQLELLVRGGTRS